MVVEEEVVTRWMVIEVVVEATLGPGGQVQPHMEFQGEQTTGPL